MKLLILIACAFIGACANPDAGYYQLRESAIANLPLDQRSQAEIDLMRDIHNDNMIKRQRMLNAMDASLSNINAPGSFGNPIYIHRY